MEQKENKMEDNKFEDEGDEFEFCWTPPVSGRMFFVADGDCPQGRIAESEALGLKLQRVTTGRWFVFVREVSND